MRKVKGRYRFAGRLKAIENTIGFSSIYPHLLCSFAWHFSRSNLTTKATPDFVFPIGNAFGLFPWLLLQSLALLLELTFLTKWVFHDDVSSPLVFLLLAAWVFCNNISCTPGPSTPSSVSLPWRCMQIYLFLTSCIGPSSQDSPAIWNSLDHPVGLQTTGFSLPEPTPAPKIEAEVTL